MKRNGILLIIILNCIVMLYACKTIEERPEVSSESGTLENNTEEKTDIGGQIEKGYDLPVSKSEEVKAETDCIETMELIADIYRDADKGNTSNVILSESTIGQMAEKVKEMGHPVRTCEPYSNMKNYRQLEEFLHSSKAGNSGSALVYYIRLDGGICREKYTYDGKDMYVLMANTSWDENNTPIVTFINYTRIKEWKYTAKGWFCYELCVPEYPEVTEVVNGSCLIRVKPITEENREMSEKCVLGLGYQGNNLFCSNWDTNCMEDLDYNGMYEYLYGMKYQQKINPEDYLNGIPKDEFENLIMDYLPVTSEMIFKSAAFDEENQTYKWTRLGCFNYAPTFFGTSVPEVTKIQENEDGTVTLTVDAVCEMILCDEAVITHELTVRFLEDGSFQYLGNKILDDGILKIPDYQYRISDETFIDKE